MIKFYHNPRCRKSRAALEYLRTKGIEPKIIDYFKNPLSEEGIKDILIKLHMKPRDIVRTQESIFKAEYKGKNFLDHEWIKILSTTPKLLKRPIVVKQNKAVLGDPIENLEKIL